ncbi:hypothetical protein [Yersinia pestis]|uniref:hypothetical protein n=1 Tax=Yersinia pestis TaxID=632 RepID=UPI001EE4D575|nr:hypothetical protein [Yersinia pestis]
MEARQGGDGLPAPFTTAPVPAREVAHSHIARKKSRQDSDISQYATVWPLLPTAAQVLTPEQK